MDRRPFACIKFGFNVDWTKVSMRDGHRTVTKDRMADENPTYPLRNLIAATDREIERRRKIAKTSGEEQERERRRFPPPWHVYLLTECFVVKDSDRRLLAGAISRTRPAGQPHPNCPSYDEAHRIAGHIARRHDSAGIRLVIAASG